MAVLDLQQKDTICAAATAVIPSALAIVRVSGPDALLIKERIFSPKRKIEQQFFVATLGDIAGVDEGICITFPQGKSFTGEASFELTLHGSPVIVNEVLQHLQTAGCRLAEPGEFSMRAVLNNKMDLCAAEAVCDLISARSVEAAQVALKNVQGELGKYLQPVRINIIDILAEVEARLDFPDEDLGLLASDRLLRQFNEAINLLENLLNSAAFGMKLIGGARVLLYGLPNAGKSTLLNSLLKEDRALVHHLPGTTRDVVEAQWVVGGIPVSLVDVAGIRDVNEADTVEILGIAKAKLELERADAVLWLVDSTDSDEETQIKMLAHLQTINAPVIKVFTKLDLCSIPNGNDLAISAKTGVGLVALEAAIHNLFAKDSGSRQEVLLTKERQKVQVQKAVEALQLAKKAFEHGEADEVVAAELRVAGGALDDLLGKSLNEDVLDLIFSRFCIGK
ncbi:MAG: tRNA uridine-5-carboxymethylaminomethyl(34) synthesis GTPase MnmE [bacterium]|nr:tRNA uridine-5-carboxymethylaminomethyl(34) synthesis GTPase MnmE [bacterium]